MNICKKETLEQACLVYVRSIGNGEHLLADDTGKLEIWFENPHHASYGVIHNGIDLEFARSVKKKGK